MIKIIYDLEREKQKKIQMKNQIEKRCNKEKRETKDMRGEREAETK